MWAVSTATLELASASGRNPTPVMSPTSEATTNHSERHSGNFVLCLLAKLVDIVCLNLRNLSNFSFISYLM